jgi:predicted esterase
VTPEQARSVCSRGGIDEAVAELRRRRVDAGALHRLLSGPDSQPRRKPWSGVVELSDEHGRRTTMAVHVPPAEPHRRLGALVVLHGAGGSGDGILPHFAPLGDELGMAVVCPTARSAASGSVGLDYAGIFGRRFGLPCWDLGEPGFPLAALRWARTELGADPDRCAVAGLSMGGLATWNLGIRFWHQLAAAVPLNGALSVWESFGTDRRARALLPNALALPLFVVHGRDDERIPPRSDRESVATLRRLGHEDLEYVEVMDGRHELSSLCMAPGTPLFRRLGRWLGHRRRAARPAEVRHRAIDDAHGRAHWVSVSGIDAPEVATLRARRPSPNAVDIEVSGAARVVVGLTGDGLTPGDVVEVSVNGVRADVRFAPELATVVETYREAADPALVAEQVVAFTVPGPPARPSQHGGAG